MAFVRKNTVEVVGSTDGALVFSLLKLLDAYLLPLLPEETMQVGERGAKKKVEEVLVPEQTTARLPELLEAFFYFALVWSVGATCDNNGRKKFDAWLREHMASNNVCISIHRSLTWPFFQIMRL